MPISSFISIDPTGNSSTRTLQQGTILGQEEVGQGCPTTAGHDLVAKAGTLTHDP